MTMKGSSRISPQVLWIAVALLVTADACSEVGEITERWKNSMNLLQGCPGPNGSSTPGDSGPIGERGIDGAQGSPGPKGEKGDLSAPGSMGVPGPHGKEGETGQDGPQGSEGVTGDPAEGPRNCKDLQDLGLVLTGWYYIYPDGSPLRVMCDMETDNGGWIVFQRRWDGSVDFKRDWQSYKRGFGNQWSEFWLGNENIHLLTVQGTYQLRVDMGDFENNNTYATYSGFRLGGESEKYTLHLHNYIGGTAGDSLSLHNNMKFSTEDEDNDISGIANCATFYSAPWWHQACFDSSLNGVYLQGEHKEKGGIAWSQFRGIKYSLRFSEMKFRPVEGEQEQDAELGAAG